MTTPSDNYDVIVLGTGAAGMTAALAATASGATVGLFEKAATVGGTTAVSGGVTWIPSHNLPVEGEVLDKDRARAYLGSVSLGYIHDDLLDAFIDSGQPMLDFVQAESRVRFSINSGFPDYYPEQPGGMPHGGRSLNPSPFPFTELGNWAEKVTRFPVDSMTFGLDAETQKRLGTQTDPETAAELAKVDGRAMGAGLIGGLLRALLDAGVEPHTDHRAVELLTENKKVTGVTFDHDGQQVTVSASKVIIATGGFEWDPQLVKTFLRGPMQGPVSPPFNEGDGLKMAMKAGAELGNMGDSWWSVVVKKPGDQWHGRERSRAVREERTRPRSIIVNKYGKRFVNEAMNYNSAAQMFQKFDPVAFEYENLPAWMIVDEGHLRKYGFLGVARDGEPADWFNSSETLDELAQKTGIDAEGLKATLDDWNQNVSRGSDPDFGRGESEHDGWWGDWEGKTIPEQTLGPVDTAPYYAVRVYPGALGTKGGPRTDINGEVQHIDGGPIEGLYAAGNAMAAVTGQAYGGGGGTIGPAMVWGYRAGMHAALGEVPEKALDEALRS